MPIQSIVPYGLTSGTVGAVLKITLNFKASWCYRAMHREARLNMEERQALITLGPDEFGGAANAEPGRKTIMGAAADFLRRLH